MPASRAQEGARHAPTAGRMDAMPAIPESTKTSLAQRLRAHARENWPQLAAVCTCVTAPSSPTSKANSAAVNGYR